MGSSRTGPHSQNSGVGKRPEDTHHPAAFTDDREAELDAREALAVADEFARHARKQRNKDIVSEAEERDVRADARDSTAERRDRDASLAGFLNDDSYGDNLQLRRSAASDRLRSKEDRSLAASDRSAMADVESSADSETHRVD